MLHAHLRVVPVPGEDSRPDQAPEGADVGLLVFLFVVHSLPLLALAAGSAWGAGAIGYATAVAVLTGRAIARELGGRFRASRRGSSR